MFVRWKAGFSPLEVIKIATLNGAVYLGREKQIGWLAPGTNADRVRPSLFSQFCSP